ncbi:hypothetical protein BC937DRAFT_94447 [Endogone sp. FLAS-F59071]|nr:hypothetical protein BC937DRAFT_94447 [Endogone sp. FLAS-F59071]|eukprot:RUS20763.1 hypothetical protein BC937DRAFT_94447 [Endogone sp. FLAS-F59071]
MTTLLWIAVSDIVAEVVYSRTWFGASGESLGCLAAPFWVAVFISWYGTEYISRWFLFKVSKESINHKGQTYQGPHPVGTRDRPIS